MTKTRGRRLDIDMPPLPPNVTAALTGLLSGILLSIPVGPVNLTIINEGARRGWLWALMIGYGAISMELIYCAIAFTGFASFFSGGLVKAAMELASFVFMLYIGWRFLSARGIPTDSSVTQRITTRLHPRSAYATGFVRVLGNPAVFLFWIVLAANFISREWVPPTWPGKISCVAGVGCGAVMWFTVLSYLVSRGGKKLTDRTLLRLEHGSGLCLIILALLHGGRIVWEMSRHRR